MKNFVQFGRMVGILFVLAVGVLAVAPEGARAATCAASCSTGKTCACQETCPSPGVIKSGTFDNCSSSDGYVCCETASSSTCKGTCQEAACPTGQKDESTECNEKCKNDDPEHKKFILVFRVVAGVGHRVR